MVEMDKYVLVPKGPFKISLLAKAEEPYVFVIRENMQISLTESDERYLLYIIFQLQSRSQFSAHIRHILNPNITPMDIDTAWDRFKEAHDSTPVDVFRMEDIPLQAHQEKGLDLPIPWYVCVISLKDEEEILSKLRTMYRDEGYSYLKSWFTEYCNRYSYELKKCKNAKYEELADSFLKQHMLDRWQLYNILPDKPSDPNAPKKKLSYRQKQLRDELIGFLSCIIIGVLSLWLAGEVFDGWDDVGWSVFFSFVGFTSIGIAINIISE